MDIKAAEQLRIRNGTEVQIIFLKKAEWSSGLGKRK